MTPRPAAVPVVCAIIERSGRFLAAKRAPGQSNGMLWEFPGGKVKDGETAEYALARELREELRVGVRVQERLASHNHAYPWISIELIPFVCLITSGEPHPCEHAEIRWVDKKEASALEWAPADIPVLNDYLTSFR